MSEVRLIVRDGKREIFGDCHAAVAESAIAALSADPETIEELDSALERFVKPDEWSFFRIFRDGGDDRPHDAGIVIIDLAARLVACDTTYFMPSAKGSVAYHNGRHATDRDIDFQLSDEWQLMTHVDGWQAIARQRREDRAANPPFDVRAVVYGRPLAEFIAAECRQAASEHSRSDDEVGEREIVKDIHARWMLTPRDDLRGQAPRDLLVARRKTIGWDMQFRCNQWSMLGECPRGLDPDSHAYRFGGFGTHELVLYYEMVRALVWDCWTKLTEGPGARGEPIEDEISRLEAARERWLDSPDPESYGRTPRSMIENERRRIPEVMSPHEAIIDCDCPLCQMSAEMPGPTFWHLDGCNMDPDFAFSFHRTREEWEEQERDYEEFSRRFNEKMKEEERLGLQSLKQNGPWQHSFVSDDENVPAPIRLFQIGTLLAELIVDLKEPVEDRPLIDRLHRDFGNLRDIIQGDDLARAEALLPPVLDRFAETLADVATARDDLRAKCEDLESRTRRIFEAAPIERAQDDR